MMNENTLLKLFSGRNLEIVEMDLQGMVVEILDWLDGGEIDANILDYMLMSLESLETSLSK